MQYTDIEAKIALDIIRKGMRHVDAGKGVGGAAGAAYARVGVGCPRGAEERQEGQEGQVGEGCEGIVEQSAAIKVVQPSRVVARARRAVLCADVHSRPAMVPLGTDAEVRRLWQRQERRANRGDRISETICLKSLNHWSGLVAAEHLNVRHNDGTRQIATCSKPSFHPHHSERSTASAVSLDSRTSCNGNCCPIRLELGSYETAARLEREEKKRVVDV